MLSGLRLWVLYCGHYVRTVGMALPGHDFWCDTCKRMSLVAHEVEEPAKAFPS